MPPPSAPPSARPSPQGPGVRVALPPAPAGSVPPARIAGMPDSAGGHGGSKRPGAGDAGSAWSFAVMFLWDWSDIRYRH